MLTSAVWTYRNLIVHVDILFCASDSAFTENVFENFMIGVIGFCVCQRKGEIENCLCVCMESNMILFATSDGEVINRVSQLANKIHELQSN